MAIEYTPLESSNLVNNPSEGGNFSVGSPAEIADALSFASEAKKAQVAAELAEANAEGSASNAATSATNASSSATTASSAVASTATSATNASNSATTASTAATNASNSETAASTSETNAATSATTATTKASEAATSATNASTSETNAATSATTATTKAGEASTSASNAATSATSAATAKTNAETAETNAETAETNAAASATTATNQATAANTSATNAATSATTATTKASEAATSATNASNSETAASTSATNASNSETASGTSATNAATSASTATTKASEAVTSASNAATSATAAATAKTNAETAETNAETAETNAAASATTATNQATAAGTSATNAAASATTATTKASEASTSATNAETAETAAVAAKDAALAAFDSFDDRYLGQKSSDPGTDNDGDALAAGMLYFNTTSDVMKVYEGSNWVAAYASATGSLLAANNLSDLANAGSARSNLGLGSAATSASSAFATASQADQTVGLTGAGATSISGTYPNFTITSTDTNTNTTYSIQDGELSQNNFTNADHTKLNNIETSADVTDATNVGAAGALMDSEVTNLAEVKAFDSSDYATAAQGTLAANALPKAGGTVTGALVLNNTGSVKVAAGTTGQREASPAAGMFRYNTTEGKFEGYSTEWGEIGGGAADLKLNSFTGNGSTVAYTLSSSPAEDNTLVYIDGVYQNKTGYAIVDNVLTFSAAPDSGAAIEITAATIAPVEASTEFKLSQFTGNGSATAFSLSEATPENNTNVYWDGVYQSKANYSVSGTTLTFSTAPPNGVAVEVMAAHAVVVSVSTPDDNTVSTVKIVNSAVTTAKIADANVTTAKITDGAITSAKLGAGVGGAFNDFAIKTSAYTAVTRDQLIVNSSSTVTITLPASPSAGNVVFIKNAGTGTVTVGRNGSKINSTTDDGSLAADAGATLVFVDATIGWKEL